MNIGKKIKNAIWKRVNSNNRIVLENEIITWLNSADIKIVDVGARGNSLPEFDLIAECSHLYACEPDPAEAARIIEVLNNKWKQVTVFSDALYSTQGDAFLNITQREGLSSLLKPNEKIVTRYYPKDNIYSITDVIKVDVIPLDTASVKYDFADACFLKIDTQGTELEILRSGEELLKNTVVGVHVEVEFHEFYSGQSLFFDVDKYLYSLGFSLFDLEKRYLRRSSFDENLYSRRQLVWGNALYLREPLFMAGNWDKNISFKKLKQLLSISLCFGYFDLSMEILSLLKPYEDVDKITDKIRKYIHTITSTLVTSRGTSILNHGAKEKKIP